MFSVVAGRSVHAATISASAASDRMGFRLNFESMLTPGPARFGNGMALSPLKVDFLLFATATELHGCHATQSGGAVSPNQPQHAMKSWIGADHVDAKVKLRLDRTGTIE